MNKEFVPHPARRDCSRSATQFQTFQSPLTTRYGSPEMLYNFSDEYRFMTHRRIWIGLAESERLPPDFEQIICIPKPFTKKILLDTMSQVLQERRAVGAAAVEGQG